MVNKNNLETILQKDVGSKSDSKLKKFGSNLFNKKHWKTIGNKLNTTKKLDLKSSLLFSSLSGLGAAELIVRGHVEEGVLLSTSFGSLAYAYTNVPAAYRIFKLDENRLDTVDKLVNKIGDDSFLNQDLKKSLKVFNKSSDEDFEIIKAYMDTSIDKSVIYSKFLNNIHESISGKSVDIKKFIKNYVTNPQFHLYLNESSEISDILETKSDKVIKLATIAAKSNQVKQQFSYLYNLDTDNYFEIYKNLLELEGGDTYAVHCLDLQLRRNIGDDKLNSSLSRAVKRGLKFNNLGNLLSKYSDMEKGDKRKDILLDISERVSRTYFNDAVDFISDLSLTNSFLSKQEISQRKKLINTIHDMGKKKKAKFFHRVVPLYRLCSDNILSVLSSFSKDYDFTNIDNFDTNITNYIQDYFSIDEISSTLSMDEQMQVFASYSHNWNVRNSLKFSSTLLRGGDIWEYRFSNYPTFKKHDQFHNLAKNYVYETISSKGEDTQFTYFTPTTLKEFAFIGEYPSKTCLGLNRMNSDCLVRMAENPNMIPFVASNSEGKIVKRAFLWDSEDYVMIDDIYGDQNIDIIPQAKIFSETLGKKLVVPNRIFNNYVSSLDSDEKEIFSNTTLEEITIDFGELSYSNSVPGRVSGEKTLECYILND
jgi:hypothetical protein